MTITFECEIPNHVVYQVGSLARLGEETRKLTDGLVLLVSDSGVAGAGIVKRAEACLADANVRFVTWLGVEENPTTETVSRGVSFARTHRPECIIGLGGGSSMDCAKGINFIFSNGGQMQDYWGVGKANKPMLPMIAVPTTAGTGSETQSYALISDAVTHAKMACGDKKAAFRRAILDPELTVSQPRSVAIATAVDAIGHALESAVTTRRNPKSMAYSAQAWSLLARHFKTMLDDPDDLDARGALQLGAMFGGAAIEHSMLGAAHSCANPLTARNGVTHGIAVALMLPHVIRFNANHVGDTYRDLCLKAGLNGQSPSGNALADYVSELVADAGIDQRLASYGVAFDQLPKLAEEASRQWTAQFNPRPVQQGDLLSLYQEAYS